MALDVLPTLPQSPPLPIVLHEACFAHLYSWPNLEGTEVGQPCEHFGRLVLRVSANHGCGPAAAHFLLMFTVS